MKSNYKPLGDYIQEVNIRNSDLAITKLLGVSMEKTFIPSVANIIGVDLSIYKVLKKDQLACKLMSVGRDEKLPVDLYKEQEPAIVSSAYYVFEPKNKEELLPEFLFMWLCRPENDRYIGFVSGGDVRGGISWDMFCSIPIKVPHIDTQRQIVAEYNVIQNRIAVNQQLIQKLEDTAQTIYKQWFVDFEFPDEEGKPYLSNGGAMVWNEELQKEIPQGWEYEEISTIAKDVITGKTPPTNNEDNFGNFMPFVTIPDLHNNPFVETAIRFLSKKGVAHQKNKTLPIGSICVSCIGTAGLTSITAVECQTNQQINSILCKDEVSVYYIYITLSGLKKQIIEWGGKGSIGVNMNKNEFSKIKIEVPQKKIMYNFDKVIKPIFELLKIYLRANRKFTGLKTLLLSKLATI